MPCPKPVIISARDLFGPGAEWHRIHSKNFWYVSLFHLVSRLPLSPMCRFHFPPASTSSLPNSISKHARSAFYPPIIPLLTLAPVRGLEQPLERYSWHHTTWCPVAHIPGFCAFRIGTNYVTSSFLTVKQLACMRPHLCTRKQGTKYFLSTYHLFHFQPPLDQ
jgi:hypothetical protein